MKRRYTLPDSVTNLDLDSTSISSERDALCLSDIRTSKQDRERIGWLDQWDWDSFFLLMWT